jgi:hypothetical protein
MLPWSADHPLSPLIVFSRRAPNRVKCTGVWCIGCLNEWLMCAETGDDPLSLASVLAGAGGAARMARRGMAGNREALGRNEISWFQGFLCGSHARYVVYAKGVVCCTVHVHEGSMQPHAVLTGLTGALEHMTGELPSRTLGDGTYARIRYRIENFCFLMDVDFRGNFDSSSRALAMKNLGRARAFATRRHGKLQVWEFSERQSPDAYTCKHA